MANTNKSILTHIHLGASGPIISRVEGHAEDKTLATSTKITSTVTTDAITTTYKTLTTNTKVFSYFFVPTVDLSLVTSKHWDKTNFLAFLTQHLIIVDAAKQLAAKMQDYFSLDFAIGAQLDILGELVGVSRYVNFEPSVDSPTLDDATYRFCIKAKIAQNQ